MAKFCGNCGAQMEDFAVVCGNCGAPLEAAPPAGAPGNPLTKYVDPAKQEQMKKIIKIACVGAAALAVVIVALVLLVNNTGWKGATKKIMNAYLKEDADAISEMTCSSWDDMHSESELEDSISGTMSYFDDAYDDGEYKLSYEKKSDASKTNKQMDRILKDKYGYYVSEDKIAEILDQYKDFHKVDVTIKAKSGGKTRTRKITLYFAKESGDWKLFDLERNS